MYRSYVGFIILCSTSTANCGWQVYQELKKENPECYNRVKKSWEERVYVPEAVSLWQNRIKNFVETKGYGAGRPNGLLTIYENFLKTMQEGSIKEFFGFYLFPHRSWAEVQLPRKSEDLLDFIFDPFQPYFEEHHKKLDELLEKLDATGEKDSTLYQKVFQNFEELYVTCLHDPNVIKSLNKQKTSEEHKKILKDWFERKGGAYTQDEKTIDEIITHEKWMFCALSVLELKKQQNLANTSENNKS